MNERFLIWKNPKHAIYALMFILMIFGCINVYSASFVSAEDMLGNSYHYLLRYFMFIIVGFIGLKFVTRMGYRTLLGPNWLLFGYVAVLVMLIIVEFFGVSTKGAARWIPIGPFSLQPSEFAKLAVIMFSAGILGPTLKKEKSFFLLHGSPFVVLVLTMIYAILVYIQPDLGTAAIIVGLMFGILVLAGMHKSSITCFLMLAAVGVVVFATAFAYRSTRIKLWLNPWADPTGHGYQMVQSLLAIGSGGWTGQPWGMGAGKFLYLPEAHTDFAFAIWCQEWGFLGALCLMFVFFLLGLAFIKITANTRDRSGFLLASGVTFLIIGQAVANMAMVCGVLPVIGVPLVFMSYGGSSMLVSMLAIGLIISVYETEVRDRRLEAESPETRRDKLRVVSGRKEVR